MVYKISTVHVIARPESIKSVPIICLCLQVSKEVFGDCLVVGDIGVACLASQGDVVAGDEENEHG